MQTNALLICTPCLFSAYTKVSVHHPFIARSFCVYPSETRQYASRLVATAWDLARTPGGRVVGFSGAGLDTAACMTLCNDTQCCGVMGPVAMRGAHCPATM